MHAIDTAEITIRLNAAEPTIVDGPSSPGSFPKFVTVSITERRISGADDPNAISVRLAIVGFHTETFIVCSTPSMSVYLTALVCEVMTSIESINMSETRAIPKNRYTKPAKYAIISTIVGRREVPGIRIQE